MVIAEKQVKRADGQMMTLRSLRRCDAVMMIQLTLKIAQTSEYMAREVEEVDQSMLPTENRIQMMAEEPRMGYIGAFMEEELLGYLGLFQVDPKQRMQHRCAIGLGVRPADQGMGIGRRLLEEGIAQAVKLGYEQMELDVVEENTAGMHLYEASGFQLIGTIPHGFKMKDGRYHDLIMMVRPLHNEDA